MKKLNIIVVCLLCLFISAPVMADWFGGVGQWDRTYYEGNGGEFTLYGYDDKPFLSNSAYANETKNIGYQGSFETFCLEGGEYISEPMGMIVSTTSIDQSTGAVGLDGSGSHAVKGGMTYGDNLDQATAYLYTQFATGQLTGYHYAASGIDPDSLLTRAQSAGALQKAIWYIEQETIGSYTGQSKIWVDEANKAISDGLWSGIGNVRVLNMYGYSMSSDTINYCTLKQDQLYLVPVPGAILLGMLGLGVAGLKLRKFA